MLLTQKKVRCWPNKYKFVTGVGGVKAEDTIEFTIAGGVIDEDTSHLQHLTLA